MITWITEGVGNENTCHGCRWHDDFIGTCCNGESEWRGDFTFVRCEKYEEAWNE